MTANESILYIKENDYNALVAKLQRYESLYMARQETVEVLTEKLAEFEAERNIAYLAIKDYQGQLEIAAEKLAEAEAELKRTLELYADSLQKAIQSEQLIHALVQDRDEAEALAQRRGVAITQIIAKLESGLCKHGELCGGFHSAIHACQYKPMSTMFDVTEALRILRNADATPDEASQ